MAYISQSAYAERIGISQAAIAQRIKRGKYHGCTRKINGVTKIDPEKAILVENERFDKQKQIGGNANKAKHQGNELQHPLRNWNG